MTGSYVQDLLVERGKGTSYLQLRISVFLRETNTSTIFTLEFFFVFIIFCYSKEGWFVLKGFRCNKKKYLTLFPVWEGRRKYKCSEWNLWTGHLLKEKIYLF